jgi:hypothetical protein
MPIIPAGPTAPYGTVGDVLQLARVYVNDAMGPNGIAGDILASPVPATAVLLNSAWRELQEELADSGVETLCGEALIPSIPSVALTDPSVQVYLNWVGYWNGAGAINTAFVLPQDFIQPRGFLWERASGSATQFSPVHPVDKLPEGYQTDQLRWYEWRGDSLWFKGATRTIDLKVPYVSYLPDLAPAGSAIAESTQVPIMRASRALAYLIAAEYAAPRGSEAADGLHAKGVVEIEKITNRTARRKASITYRRRAFGS